MKDQTGLRNYSENELWQDLILANYVYIVNWPVAAVFKLRPRRLISRLGILKDEVAFLMKEPIPAEINVNDSSSVFSGGVSCGIRLTVVNF